MDCSACGGETVDFSIPEEFREDTAEDAPAAAICRRCLTVEPRERGEDDPDFSAVSEAFPRRPDRAVPLALAIGYCDSLATNRGRIEALLESVERAGTDPLLVIDRLVDDPTLEPAIDLEGRRHQLEELLY